MLDWLYLQAQAWRLRRNVLRALKTDVDLCTKVQYLRKDNRLVHREAKGVRAYWIARGGFIESSTMTTHLVESPQDLVGFHVYEVQEKLRDPQTWREMTQLAAERLTDEIVCRIAALEVAGQLAQHPERQLVFGICVDKVDLKAYLEPDNWYFHVLMRVTAGGMVL